MSFQFSTFFISLTTSSYSITFLVQSFYYRNLKPQMRALFGTLISITDELYASLYQNSFHKSLVERLANPPPQSV